MTAPAPDIPLDTIGVGIGPSNLSVAALLSKCPQVRAVFFDWHPQFQWHQGLLLNGTTLQTSFLKDLVTPVDPTHPCSFLNFLHEQGRLYLFMNAEFPRVLRSEFNEYFRWACTKLSSLRFGVSVRSIDFDGSLFRVDIGGGQPVTARSVVLGVGVAPVVPACCRAHLGGIVHHAIDFLPAAAKLRGRRVAIVGGGQTGAEIVLHLLRDASVQPTELVWVSRRTNFLPLDESAFVNEMFTPAYADHFFGLDRQCREALLGQYRLASDGISAETIGEIYRELYRHQLIDRSPVRIRLLPGQELTGLSREAIGVAHLTLTDVSTGATQAIDTDAVVLCTGFAPQAHRLLSDALRERLGYEGDGLCLGPDYSARWKNGDHSRLFILNAARAMRGIADPNLSLLAWRASLVVNSIVGRTVYPDRQRHTFVEWAPNGNHRLAVPQ